MLHHSICIMQHPNINVCDCHPLSPARFERDPTLSRAAETRAAHTRAAECLRDLLVKNGGVCVLCFHRQLTGDSQFVLEIVLVVCQKWRSVRLCLFVCWFGFPHRSLYICPVATYQSNVHSKCVFQTVQAAAIGFDIILRFLTHFSLARVSCGYA